MKVFIFISLLFLSCAKQMSPESALENFVKYRFSSNQSKSDILELTTGEFKDFIGKLDEENFKTFIETKFLKYKKFKVLYKNCENEEMCFVTYVTSYVQTNGAQKYYVEVKKIAELTNVDGAWLISDVSDIKSHIEASILEGQ